MLGFIIADDGVEGRYNRLSLLNPNYQEIGVGIVEDKEDCYVVIILAEDFKPFESFKDEINNYKSPYEKFTIIENDQEKF